MVDPGQTHPAPQPDLRILQANERTLLAWLRTGLAIMAFGFVMARIDLWKVAGLPAEASWSVWIGVAFLVVGTACHPVAAVRFLRTREAILAGRSILSGSATVVLLAASLMVLGIVLTFFVILR